MPVNSISFNNFLGLIWGAVALSSSAVAQLPPLSEAEMGWLAAQIYKNECNSTYQCLTSWNEGEDFPSLGIGHFIWYQKGQQEVFEETFPQLLGFIKSNGVDVPQWVENLENYDSPWESRSEFLAAQQSSEVIELREFLHETRGLQAEFIARRLSITLEQLLSSEIETEQEKLKNNFQAVLNAQSPNGIYALIDYLHFKGSGLKKAERYNGQGWGLLQVLQTMEPNTSLEGFVNAANEVLSNRVLNAPSERREERWLQGWRNRLQTYLPSSQR